MTNELLKRANALNKEIKVLEETASRLKSGRWHSDCNVEIIVYDEDGEKVSRLFLPSSGTLLDQIEAGVDTKLAELKEVFEGL